MNVHDALTYAIAVLSGGPEWHEQTAAADALLRLRDEIKANGGTANPYFAAPYRHFRAIGYNDAQAAELAGWEWGWAWEDFQSGITEAVRYPEDCGMEGVGDPADA